MRNFGGYKKLGVLLFMGLLVVWGLTDVRSRASFDPLKPEKHRTDLTVFTEAGAAFYDGRDPYEVANPRGWKYPNPPLFAMLAAPLQALDSQWQGVIWFGLSFAMAWGCFIEARLLMAGARSVFTWTDKMKGALLARPFCLRSIACKEDRWAWPKPIFCSWGFV